MKNVIFYKVYVGKRTYIGSLLFNQLLVFKAKAVLFQNLYFLYCIVCNTGNVHEKVIH